MIIDSHTIYHEVAHAIAATHYGAACDVLLRGSDAERWRLTQIACGITDDVALAYSPQARGLPWRSRASIDLAGPACDFVTHAPYLRDVVYSRHPHNDAPRAARLIAEHVGAPDRAAAIAELAAQTAHILAQHSGHLLAIAERVLASYDPHAGACVPVTPEMLHERPRIIFPISEPEVTAFLRSLLEYHVAAEVAT